MKLFTIDADFKVELNKEWIMLIPEFRVLVHRDKGKKEKGDYDGRLKYRARKEFTFIYFDLDFGSPLRDWDEFARREEAIKYAGLEEKDLDYEVMQAHKCYNNLLLESSRSLRTLRAIKKSMDAVDKQMEDIDFSAVDKKGEPINNMNTHLLSIQRLGPTYAAIRGFEKDVEDELKGSSSIRGQGTLGLKEAKKRDTWVETPEKKTEDVKQTDFNSIAELLQEDDNEEEETT